MSDPRRVAVVFTWQAVLFAVLTLSCARSEEFEPKPTVPQPGCAVGSSGALMTTSSGGPKTGKLPADDPPPPRPNRTSCESVHPTKLDLLVMYDAALLRKHPQQQIEEWIRQKVVEANQLFANSGARKIQYELLAIRPVSARMPDTQKLTDGRMRVRIREILHDWVRDGNSILRRYRHDYGADMAMFIATPYEDASVGGGLWDVCGIATLPLLNEKLEEIHADPPDGQARPFGNDAFAVVEYRCGEPEGSKGRNNDFTFAHELGHTLGMDHNRSPNNVLFPFAYGAMLNNTSPPLATVMSCDGTFSNAEIPYGVCNRIPYFSSPDRFYSIPGCTQQPCRVPTGTVGMDNARVACERAPKYAAFRERSRNQPPLVSIRSVQAVAPDGTVRDVGSELPGGTTVVITADAWDREQGDLTSTIQWINHRGEIIGIGEALSVQLLQPGDFFVTARVTDFAGLVAEWVLTLRVALPPDAFEVHDASSAGYSVVPFNSHQDRNFHIPGDVDRLMSGAPANPGDTIRVRLVPLGERAAPLMDVELWQASSAGGTAISLGSGLRGELQHTLTANQWGTVRVRIRNAGDAAGLGTDYQVYVERLQQQQPSVSPRVGPWGNMARSGAGMDFQRTSDGRYVAWWFTYRTDGSPIWYVSDVAPIEGTRWHSPLYASTWNGWSNTLELVGTVEMSFSSETSATFSWSFPAMGVQGSEPYTFYVFDYGATGVANGVWYPPSESGWGISLSHQGDVGVITVAAYDVFGQPTWAQARADGDPSSWVFLDLYQYTAPGLCPSCDGSQPVTLHRNLGTAHFSLWDAALGTGALTVQLSNVAAIGEWYREGIPMQRLTARTFGFDVTSPKAPRGGN